MKEIQNMIRRQLASRLTVILTAAALGGCTEQAAERFQEQNREQVRAAKDIDPPADEALRKMSDTLSRASSFSFQATAMMDEHIAPGQLAQSTRQARIVLCRPNRLCVESHEGNDVWTLWYQGRDVTLLDKTGNAYASMGVPGRIDQMLDEAASKHGLTLPLSDLLYSNPYRALTHNALMGRYVGLHEVNGVKCHHLLFTQEALDWQIWIDSVKEAVPRKLVIDYKAAVDRPQFTAILSDWSLSVPAGDEQFTAAIPQNAKKVDLVKLLQEEQGE
jgi:hypothetical protein